MCCPDCGARPLAVDATLLPADRHEESTERATRVHCEVCGSSWTDPSAVLDFAPDLPPTAGVRRRARSLRMWEDHLEKPLFRLMSGEDRQALTAWTTRWLRPGTGPVVDLCCLTGRTTRELARWVGVARLIAFDDDLQVLASASEHRRDPGLAYVRCHPTRLPFAGQSVGAVNIGNGWLGLHDIEATLREAQRVLSPDGTLTGSFLLRRGRPLSVLAGPGLRDQEELRQLLDQTALTTTALSVFGSVAFVAARRIDA